MVVVVIDDKSIWLDFAERRLTVAGYAVKTILVQDPERYVTKQLPAEVAELLTQADGLLVDNRWGNRVSSLPFICVVRTFYPRLPIIRWAVEDDPSPFFTPLQVTTLSKPNYLSESDFIRSFESAWQDQRSILAGALTIFDLLGDDSGDNPYLKPIQEIQARQISEIAKLATMPRVYLDRGHTWSIIGQEGEITKQALGHCLCDGLLTAADLLPHWNSLQRVIARFEQARNIDDHFRVCAEFIKEGCLDELELMYSCY